MFTKFEYLILNQSRNKITRRDRASQFSSPLAGPVPPQSTLGERHAGVILHDEAGVRFLRNYVAVSPSVNRLRRSARHNRHHCVAPTFGFTSSHLMAPEPASTAYTPQPRGEANVAKTTPTAAAIASTTTRARIERVTAKSARPRWPRPGWGGG